jgi:phosphoribosylformylglycinamidine synthase
VRIEQLEPPRAAAGASPPATRYEDLLRRLLAEPGIASKQAVFQQYDYMVRTNSLVGPGLTDAAVLRVKETGQGLVVATDGSGRHVLLDSHFGGARAVLESARNVVACGGEPIGITNCLNFGSPEKPDRMWQFVQSLAGMRHALNELSLPVTGGNVSFYNETAGHGVLPTPVIGMVGLLEKAEQYIPNRAAEPGLELFLLGGCDPRLDGSTLLYELGRVRTGELAPHDYAMFRSCQRFLVKAARERALAACHDISDGGLLTAVVEMCGGARIELGEIFPDLYDDEEHNKLATLFGEEGHRWLLAVHPDKRSWVRTAALHFSMPLVRLGETQEGTLTVELNQQPWFECPMEPLMACYRDGLTLSMSG